MNDKTNNPETFYILLLSSEYRTNWIWNIPCSLFISTREINTGRGEDNAILNDNKDVSMINFSRHVSRYQIPILNADKITLMYT